MNKLKFLFVLTLLTITLSLFANEPKHELRATWFTTHQKIDWPETQITNDATRQQQKKELTDMLDKIAAGNMQACFLQVRSLCDALYKSSYEPWAIVLTGTRGKDPGYDPLAFAIEEAHKRGLELHIWVNPFRVTSSGTLDSNDQLQQHAGEWIIKYNNGSFEGQIIDPGYPEARAYVIKVLMEIINNYDVDGIVMDDYFYPYGGTTEEDAASRALYKPADVVDVNQDGDTDDDWRRSNVDDCLKQLYDTIQAVKPWVRFGMGTFGIWSTQQSAADAYGISLPDGIYGLDDYDVQACNPVEWVKHGYVDYINPQLYWSTNVAAQDYNVLCKWWAKDVCEHFSNQLPDGKKVHFFISQAAYHAYDGYNGYDAGVGEIQKQIDVNRANLSSGYTGSVFYNTTAYNKMYLQLKESHFAHKALPPAMDWKVKEQLEAPTNVQVSATAITWQHPTAERFTIYAFPKGLEADSVMQDGKYLHRIVYGNTCSTAEFNDLANTTIAICAYDRYGVEHDAAIFNEGKFPDSDPNATEITWVLNGGELKEKLLTSNEQLWEKWKADYVTFYTNLYGSRFVSAEDCAMNNVLGFTWIDSMNKGIAAEFMTQSTDWKWLCDYMLNEAAVQGETIESDNEWRYNLYSFFNCTNAAYRVDGYCAGYTVDFSTAGQPEIWAPYYGEAVETEVQLPTQVTETYILPTPTHPAGYDFLGWYTTATFEGEAVFAIPAGWTGTLYAKWSLSTNIATILLPNQNLKVYDLMGRYMGNSIKNLSKGTYIIVTENKVYKILF